MRIPGLKRIRREVVRVRGRLIGGGVVLGYHRIAVDPEDPHGFVVSPEAFGEHLEVICRRFRPVALSELIAAPEGGPAIDGPSDGPSPVEGHDPTRTDGPDEEARRTQRRRPLALTFDDGYADVLLDALPLLERFRVPATVFVVSGSVGRELFPWDEPRGGAEGRPLTVAELRRLAANPWVRIGGHTRSHPDLREVSLGEARHELRHSRGRLEELISRRIDSFAFPHGGTSPALQRLVERLGYRRACDSSPGLVHSSTDPFRVPRFWPPDLGGREFEGWLAERVGMPRRFTPAEDFPPRHLPRDHGAQQRSERFSEVGGRP